MPLVPKMSFLSWSRMSWSIIRATLKGYPSWSASPNKSKQNVSRRWKADILQNTTRSVLLYLDALWIEECRCDIPTSYEDDLLRAYMQDQRMPRRWYSMKSRDKGDHIADLKRVFDIIRMHQLKMNLTKSFLGVASSKFFGFVVTIKRIQLDSEKIHAIQEMQPPRNLKKLRGLLGRLVYIRRFISNFSGRCQPLSKLMKKGVSFVWDNLYQEGFEEIK